MSLASTLRQIASDMLTPGKILDDIPVTVSYYSGTAGGSSTYNPTTQVVTVNETVYTPIYGVFTNPEYRQIDNVNVFADDRFFIASGDNFALVELLTRHKPSDRIVYGTLSYNVVRITTDPIQAAYIFQLRKP